MAYTFNRVNAKPGTPRIISGIGAFLIIEAIALACVFSGTNFAERLWFSLRVLGISQVIAILLTALFLIITECEYIDNSRNIKLPAFEVDDASITFFESKDKKTTIEFKDIPYLCVCHETKWTKEKPHKKTTNIGRITFVINKKEYKTGFFEIPFDIDEYFKGVEVRHY